MKKTIFFGLILASILISSGCAKPEITCDSVSSPSVNVICKNSGFYTEFNPVSGQNENKPKKVCYAYPSGESGITYRVWSFDNAGNDLKGGDIGAGGSVEVSVNADYVEAFPINLDGTFCRNKVTKVYKNEFVVS